MNETFGKETFIQMDPLVERLKLPLYENVPCNPQLYEPYHTKGLPRKFVDKVAEQKFQKQLASAFSMRKNTVFVLLYLTLNICAFIRDLFYPSKLFPSCYRIALFFRLPSIIISFILVASLLVPRFHPTVAQQQHIILFCLLAWTGIESSIRITLREPHDNLSWSNHALVIVAMGSVARIKCNWQLISSCFQIIFLILCAMIMKYPPVEIVEASLKVFSFALIAQYTVFSVDLTLRDLFTHQEISSRMASEHTESLRVLAQRASKSEQAKSQFIANMSHEIRTPLHGVITSLDLLKMSGELNAEQIDYVQVAENSATLLLDILNNILTFSKLDCGQLVLRREPINLRSIIDSVSSTFAQIAAQKGVELFSFIPPTCPTRFVSDSAHLKQILFNLVSNAVKFTEKGFVSIQVQNLKETESCVNLEISVTDTGMGVAQEDLSLLFHRFSQLDESTTRKFQGTGLGLALVSEFSSLFGGSIRVTSDGPQKGTTFSFSATFEKDCCSSLPLCSPSSISRSQSQSSSSTANSLVGHSILNSPTRSGSGSGGISPFSDWSAFVLHPNRAICSVIHSYLGHFGFSLISQNELLQPTLKTHSKTPFLFILDSTLCEDDSTIALIQLCRRRPLLLLILENPCQPHSDFGQISEIFGKWEPRSKHFVAPRIWAMKKPCRLERLESIFEQMREHVILQRSKFKRRRSSAPTVVNSSNGQTSGGGYERLNRNFLFSSASSSGDSSDRDFMMEPRRQSWTVSVASSLPNKSPKKEISMTGDPHFLNFQDLAKFKFGSDDQQPHHHSSNTAGSEFGSAPLRRVSIADPPTSSQRPTRKFPSMSIDIINQTPATNFQKRKEIGIEIEKKDSEASDSECASAPIENRENEMALKRVLIVDDNAINRKLTERLLSKAGYECTCVEDGSLAVEIVKKERFSLIFMDITMPVMDGCTATTLIRQYQSENGISPRTRICSLSAAELERLSTTDFDANLPKPVKPADLVDMANKLSNQFKIELQ